MTQRAVVVLLVGVALASSACAPRVPELRGLDESEAKKVLAAAGLVTGRITLAYDATIAAGRVRSQRPAPHAEARQGARVAVVISRGPKPARLAYENLSFSSRDINIGSNIVVSLTLSNSGHLPGRTIVNVALDGKPWLAKAVTVVGRGSKLVTATVKSRQLGRHRLSVNDGPSGTYVVRKIERPRNGAILLDRMRAQVGRLWPRWGNARPDGGRVTITNNQGHDAVVVLSRSLPLDGTPVTALLAIYVRAGAKSTTRVPDGFRYAADLDVSYTCGNRWDSWAREFTRDVEYRTPRNEAHADHGWASLFDPREQHLSPAERRKWSFYVTDLTPGYLALQRQDFPRIR